MITGDFNPMKNGQNHPMLTSALHKADISGYDNSMQPLVYKDIQKALKEIQKLKSAKMAWAIFLFILLKSSFYCVTGIISGYLHKF